LKFHTSNPTTLNSYPKHSIKSETNLTDLSLTRSGERCLFGAVIRANPSPPEKRFWRAASLLLKNNLKLLLLTSNQYAVHAQVNSLPFFTFTAHFRNMAALIDDIKHFIIQQFAEYRQPHEIVERVKNEFNKAVTRQQVFHYSPRNPACGQHWKDLYERYRAAFLKNLESIPIANQAFQLQALQEQYDRLTANPVFINEVEVRQTIITAAKIAGGMMTNRREVTSPNVKPTVTDPAAMLQMGVSFLIREGWDMERALPFVRKHWQIPEHIALPQPPMKQS
jgi:hypothetical protein